MLNPDKNGVVLTPEQVAQKKQEQQAIQKRKNVEYQIKKEALMREVGVIEVANLRIDPITGIVPSSVVLPYVWKPGETYLPESMSGPAEKLKDNGKEPNKKK